jgi:HEAT repeat protein
MEMRYWVVADQAEISRKVLSKDAKERRMAAEQLEVSFAYLPDKNKAWLDLHRLISDNDINVRWQAADALGSAFSHVPDKNQAWLDIHGLASEKYGNLRRSAAYALGSAFSHMPDKNQAWSDLYRLTSDNDIYVRAQAYHSMGNISISRAVDTENEENFKKEIEEAIKYFEKASREKTYSNPAKFCLPFYRSFYTLTFKKEEAEAEVQRYLSEAKSAVEGSESKEKLLEAIENLGNALKEAQKARDFNETKADLNAYRRYCDRACELLETTEKKAPGASRLIRKGLPIIDDRIKGIIAEIQEKAKLLCKQVKYTEYKELGQQANDIWQELTKIRDPIGLEKSVNNMLIPLSAMCEKMPKKEKGKVCELLEKLKQEQYVEDKLSLINMLLSKFSSQMNKGQDEGRNVEIEQILDKWGFRPSGISFGKREEKKADIERWLRCFEPSEFEDALLILDKIQYHDANTVSAYIERLSKEIKKIFGDDLTKVKFYPIGESPSSSGGNFLYMYRKELGLSEASFPYTPINETDFSDTKALVFFDDMIGSGNQALAFAKQHLQKITIEKYYVALLAFKEGYEKVKRSKYFKNVIVHGLLSDENRAFSSNSQVFPDKETRERIKILCEKYGKLLFPKHPLGYDNLQALIVFPHNTPNNTLPIIWASEKNEKEPGYNWYPVWERIKIVMNKSNEQSKTDFVDSQKTMQKDYDAPKFSAITEDRKISITLQELLKSKLSLDELRDFCFEKNIDYENIRGETKSEKIRELLIHLEQRNQIEIMKLWLKNKRPDIWIEISQRFDKIKKKPERKRGEACELPEISSEVNKEPKKNKSLTKIEINKSNNVQISIGKDNYQAQSSNSPINKGGESVEERNNTRRRLIETVIKSHDL